MKHLPATCIFDQQELLSYYVKHSQLRSIVRTLQSQGSTCEISSAAWQR